MATLAMLGAALTVLAQLGKSFELAPWLVGLLALWDEATRALWRPPLSLIGAPIHHDLIAAMTLAWFMAMIGVGARVSGRFSATPLAPIDWTRWLDGMSWPSLAVYAALCLIFLFGHGASAADPLIIAGSATLGKYAFAVTVTAGYVAGDFIGHDEFHRRLLRLAALVAVLVAASCAARALAGAM
ncbi:MAG TPA: hypothetical protein VNK52_14475 [Hyphomicrobiaceae bacterium]|nr:hypothetical protein [Hyphomicrobiaceae bacterium]